ncbi:DUF4270 family protein [Chondrinema litorale]|uniref:DUF4270 family protein n=1 Tax=Chondrinema litorale TaxID=2994555 RepID=UPI002543E9A8|nr:DUF4270 family protein [Chondrinema litorale]UZR93886.1 hypothetical protein OQ292_18730 [Chondrinema litorale]
MKFTTNLWGSTLNLSEVFINHFNKGLLAIVILLYFTSCNDVESIGDTLQDSDLLLKASFTDTITIETQVVYLDSVITNRALLVGTENDEKFGRTTTESFFKLYIPSEFNETFIETGNEAVFDSAKLVLTYSVVSGDETLDQTIEAYSINEFIVDTIPYYQSNTIVDVNNELLGSVTINPELDTLDRMSMRMDALGEMLFSNRTAAAMQDQDSFEEEILKGLKLQVNDTEADMYTLSFAPDNTNTSTNFSFKLYYSLPGDTISKLQTFFIGTSFFHADVDFTNTDYLAGLQFGDEINTAETGNEAYVQSGVGLTTKIKFPYLDDFAKQNPNLAINKVELSFDPVELSPLVHGTPPSAMRFFALDEDGNFDVNRLLLREGLTLTPVSSSAVSDDLILSLTYNARAGTYPVMDITTYIQSILNGSLENNGLMFNPFYSRSSIARSIIGDSNYETDPIVLRIFYTKENGSE